MKVIHYINKELKTITLVMFALMITACNGGGSTSAGDPAINSFSAAETTIALGSSVDLTAEFSGGAGVINNGVGEVSSGATISVSPATTMTYMLTVTNSAGSMAVTSFVTVTVVPAIIDNFNASSTTILIGDSVDLTAIFSAGSTGSIDNGVGDVTSGNTVSVSPTESTTYTLTVTNAFGDSVTAAATVTVVALDSLSIVNQGFDQVFQSNMSTYTATVGFLAKSVLLKTTSADSGASITVNGVAIGADGLSQSIALTEGADTMIDVVVTQNTLSKTYTITVSRQLAATFAQQAYIKASNTGDFDEFGYSVDLAGDTLAVGAFHEDSSLTGIDNTPDDDLADAAGAVYVFVRDGATWTQQAYIKASNSEAGDNFGISVAISGDTLAVGAVGDDSETTGINTTPNDTLAGDSSGAVYVFIRTGDSWSEQAYIKASNSSGGDQFGNSIALSENTLAVGAKLEGSASGAVYVYTRSESTWSEQAYIKASNPDNSDRFGHSVSLSGDTLAVGAPEEDSITEGINTTPVDNVSPGNYGAVYVFVRDYTNWNEQAYIKATSIESLDNFGFSVALDGDTLAVGSPYEEASPASANSGAVYIFTRNNNDWSQQSYIKASNFDKTDLFGYSVALSGDVLAVGAQQEDSDAVGINDAENDSATNTGAVYLFTRVGVDWPQHAYVKPLNTGDSDEFGHSVAIAGDTLAVGAHFEGSSTTGVNNPYNDSGSNTGAVYVFE